MATSDRRELKGVGYELFMLLLSLLSVFNLAFLVVAGSSIRWGDRRRK